MPTIKELFGVEIEEEFTVESKYYGAIKNCRFGGAGKLVAPGKGGWETLDLLTELIMGEAKIVKPILTPDEQDYLQAVCNPKFYQGKILSFVKGRVLGTSLYDIEINTDLADVDCCLFSFEKGIEIFKGMELDKHYTPEQLGIKL